MTDNEIKKALECCQYEGVTTCRDCPMFYTHEFDNEIDFDCGKYIYGRALNLINRQEAEIEKLKAMVNAELDTIHSLGDDYERVLEEEPILIQKAKAEAVKEFAERVKDMTILSTLNTIGAKMVEIDDIDNLVKEMVGE